MAQDMSFAAETTTDSDYANMRNFYKVELWAKDDQRSSDCCTPATELMQRAPCSMRQSSTGRAGATQSASATVWLSNGRRDHRSKSSRVDVRAWRYLPGGVYALRSLIAFCLTWTTSS
jgi:hypothetical protein